MNAIVELTGVGKTYPGPVEVLHDVDLTIARGELAAILGPSGSGKSTLLHLMGTLDRPTTGTVRIDGQDVSRLGEPGLATLRAQRIGFVFQRFFLREAASALDNAADGLLYAGVRRHERRRRAGEVLARVGLAHRERHRPADLSGGERQRVAIARALICKPTLVLADEPTGNLDSTTGRAILDLFAELNRDGTTIVLITHDAEIATAASRQIHIRDGRIGSDIVRTPA